MAEFEQTEKDRTLFVSNFDEKVTEELLYELLIQSGPVESVKIVQKDKNARRIAFATFKHDISVPYAMDLMIGVRLFGQILQMKPRSGSKYDSRSNRNAVSYFPMALGGSHKADYPPVGLHSSTAPIVPPIGQSELAGVERNMRPASSSRDQHFHSREQSIDDGLGYGMMPSDPPQQHSSLGRMAQASGGSFDGYNLTPGRLMSPAMMGPGDQSLIGNNNFPLFLQPLPPPPGMLNSHHHEPSMGGGHFRDRGERHKHLGRSDGSRSRSDHRHGSRRRDRRDDAYPDSRDDDNDRYRDRSRGRQGNEGYYDEDRNGGVFDMEGESGFHRGKRGGGIEYLSGEDRSRSGDRNEQVYGFSPHWDRRNGGGRR